MNVTVTSVTLTPQSPYRVQERRMTIMTMTLNELQLAIITGCTQYKAHTRQCQTVTDRTETAFEFCDFCPIICPISFLSQTNLSTPLSWTMQRCLLFIISTVLSCNKMLFVCVWVISSCTLYCYLQIKDKTNSIFNVYLYLSILSSSVIIARY